MVQHVHWQTCTLRESSCGILTGILRLLDNVTDLVHMLQLSFVFVAENAYCM